MKTGQPRLFPLFILRNPIFGRLRTRISYFETFEERSVLARYKEGDNFNHTNTLSISRIEI